MTTLEKAARAAYNAAAGNTTPEEDWWEDFGEGERDEWRRATAAALSSALLDPSDEVVNVADREFWATEGPTCVRMRAALRAAGVKITGKD